MTILVFLTRRNRRFGAHVHPRLHDLQKIIVDLDVIAEVIRHEAVHHEMQHMVLEVLAHVLRHDTVHQEQIQKILLEVLAHVLVLVDQVHQIQKAA